MYNNNFSTSSRKRHWEGDVFTLFFVSNTFIINVKLKLAKIQANVKQHPEAELLLFIHILHPRYQPEIIEHILKNKQNKKCLCIHEII